MVRMGFIKCWVYRTVKYVMTTHFSIMINGVKKGAIKILDKHFYLPQITY